MECMQSEVIYSFMTQSSSSSKEDVPGTSLKGRKPEQLKVAKQKQ